MHVAAAMGFEARWLLIYTAGTGSLEGFCLLVFQNSDKISFSSNSSVDANVNYFHAGIRKRCVACTVNMLLLS